MTAMIASWEELIRCVAPRSGMYVGRPKYSLVRAFIEGFDSARDDDVLHRFQQWLCTQPQHRAVNNYTWWALVLREVFEHGSEDALVYPTDDAVAIAHLFDRLREFLSEDSPEAAPL